MLELFNLKLLEEILCLTSNILMKGLVHENIEFWPSFKQLLVQ